MDCTICAFETSRRARASSRVGGPAGSGAGAPRGRLYLRLVEEPDGLTLHVNPWPGDAPEPPNDIPRTIQRKAARHGPSPEARGRTQDPYDRRARGACLHALEILTSGRSGSVACRACTSTSGCMCTESPCPCARAGAPYVSARVAVVPRPHERRCRSRVRGRGGSDPALRVPGTARRRSGCARHPNLAWGRFPIHQSLAGRLSVTGDGRGPKPKATAAAKAIGHGFAFGAVGGMFAPRVALPAIIMKPQDSATLRARSRG